jgi:8-oxo-dGTP pyrophosphatase MutT (NUDIX family)
VAQVNLVGPGSGAAVAIVAVVLVLAAITAAILVIRARRLDRLHVRTDAAAAALIAALDRRAAVVRAVAATAGPVALADPDRRALRGAAQAAEVAGAGEAREAAENDLAHRLRPLDTAALPADLAAELADAHARVAVARHVHNDAVRDTRALRSRRMVRWLKLAGTAPVPRYFEIAEPEASAGPAPAPARDAVRVVVLDAAGRVLLLRGVDPARPAESFWFTPGGGVGAGEDLAVAAARELTAGTGLVVPPEDLAGPLWTRSVVFVVDGVTYAGRELYLLARLEEDEPDVEPTARVTDEGVDAILERRWWTATELAATVDVVHPHQLAELLAEPAALEAGATPVAIH